MILGPSPPAKLVKMQIRVVSLGFDLYVLYHRSLCTQLSRTTEKTSKEGGWSVYTYLDGLLQISELPKPTCEDDNNFLLVNNVNIGIFVFSHY